MRNQPGTDDCIHGDGPGMYRERSTEYPSPRQRGITVYEALDLPAADLRRIMAVHHAGHAVAALHSEGVRLTRMRLSADLAPEGSHAGETRWEGQGTWQAAGTIRAAGEQAQLKWLRERGLDTAGRLGAAEAIAAADVRDAVAEAAEDGVSVLWGQDGVYEGASGISAGWCWFQRQAMDLATRHWAEVQVLAEAVDLRGKLTWEQ